MRAAAVVINHNGGEDLGRCLEALAQQTVGLEIILVDNASTDASRAWVISPRQHVQVVALEENLGYTGGANAGLAACSPEVEVVGFFNPDCFPRKDFFAVCLDAFRQHPEIAGLAPRLLREDEITLDSCGQVLSKWVLMVKDRGFGKRDTSTFLHPEPVLAACGAGMVYRRSALEQVKIQGEVFPQEFFAFWEDMDLGLRLFNAGLRVWYWPQAVAIHRRGATAVPGKGRLMFRRSAKAAAGVILNRWATLIRNLHVADVWWRLPLLILWDLVMVLALVFRKPKTLITLLGAPRRIRLAFSQRQRLVQRALKELHQ